MAIYLDCGRGWGVGREGSGVGERSHQHSPHLYSQRQRQPEPLQGELSERTRKGHHRAAPTGNGSQPSPRWTPFSPTNARLK